MLVRKRTSVKLTHGRTSNGCGDFFHIRYNSFDTVTLSLDLQANIDLFNFRIIYVSVNNVTKLTNLSV